MVVTTASSVAAAADAAIDLPAATHLRFFVGARQPKQRRSVRSAQVHGVGPRMALGVLSGMSDLELIQAIAAGDRPRLIAVKGVGRKTYDSIGRPLPGRETIVVTRNTELRIDGCTICHSLDAALAMAESFEKPIFIAGGGELYRQAIGQADEIHLTTISLEATGDVYFPEVPSSFKVVEEQHYSTNFNYTYQLLRRI